MTASRPIVRQRRARPWRINHRRASFRDSGLTTIMACIASNSHTRFYVNFRCSPRRRAAGSSSIMDQASLEAGLSGTATIRVDQRRRLASSEAHFALGSTERGDGYLRHGSGTGLRCRGLVRPAFRWRSLEARQPGTPHDQFGPERS